MDLCVMPRLMNRMMYDTMRDFDRFERSIFPYWREADHSALHVANETQQIVDDDKKFAVSLDVSQFRPKELNVHLEGRELTIEGKQEHKTENGAIHRSFTRKWLLPEYVDLESVRTHEPQGPFVCGGAEERGGPREEKNNSYHIRSTQKLNC